MDAVDRRWQQVVARRPACAVMAYIVMAHTVMTAVGKLLVAAEPTSRRGHYTSLAGMPRHSVRIPV